MPYATAILSTLKRSSTLPFSLASVQAQTEQRLEILVVLDGATQACREVALNAARCDARVRVLDLPKDRGAGEFNVDFAISTSRSDRIFYIDDDDLWLPNHVERLGPLLDHADVADSRVCSVDRRGGLHLGPCRGSSQRIRSLLGSAQLKLLYDTHMGHRKDAYGKFSTWFAHPETGFAVYGLLAGFANHPDCRWASCDAVTALSIHGASRPDMSPAARANEIAQLGAQLGEMGGVLSRTNSLFHLFRLLMIDRPDGGTLDDYLATRGGYGRDYFGGPERDLFALFTPAPPSEPAAVALACSLAEPVEYGGLFESIAAAYFTAYGQLDHERILLAAATQTGPNQALRLAAYSVALCRRDAAEALAVARQAVALGPDPVGSLARWAGKLSQQTLTSPGARPG